MIHISQDSVSCIDGKHDNDSLSENVVVLFIKYYCKKWYVPISVSSRLKKFKKNSKKKIQKKIIFFLRIYSAYFGHP